MKKKLSYVIILIFALILVLNLKQNYQNNINYKKDLDIYKNQIYPIIQEINSSNLWDISEIKDLKLKQKIENSIIKSISNNNDEMIIKYNYNIVKEKSICIYMYQIWKYSNLDIWKWYQDDDLDNLLLWKFSYWFLYKIGNDYWKYCMYPITNIFLVRIIIFLIEYKYIILFAIIWGILLKVISKKK